MPVDLRAIAALYGVRYDNSESLYHAAFQISSSILALFGLFGEDKAQYFAVRILAPIIVLDAINVTSPADVSELTGLPIKIADQRFNRLQELKKRGTIGLSGQERAVLSQFRHWIDAQGNPSS